MIKIFSDDNIYCKLEKKLLYITVNESFKNCIKVFLQSALKCRKFLYIPIVNVTVFWDGHYKVPDDRFSWNFTEHKSWCILHVHMVKKNSIALITQ